MGPVEVVFLIIQIIFAHHRCRRGYAKELGNTVILMTAIFILAFFQDRIDALVQTRLRSLRPSTGPTR